MKAAVYEGPGAVCVRDVEKPSAGADEYLVRVLYSGLCGTDVKTYKQGHRYFKPPCILGHEFSGQIEGVGSNLDASLVGKRVTCAPYVSCYTCDRCGSGLYELCADKDGIGGTFAEYITIPAGVAKKGLVVLDEGSDARELSLTEPLACVLNSVRKIGFKPGDDLLVMGAGPMGLIHVEVLRKFGAGKIIVSDFNKERLEIAESIGAIPVVPEAGEIRDCLMVQTKGRGVRHVIVAVGIPSAVEEAFGHAGDGATINIFGGLADKSVVSIDPNVIHYREVRLVGSFGFSPADFKLAAALLECGRISLKAIITHEFGIDEIVTAMEMSLGQQTVKAVIRM